MLFIAMGLLAFSGSFDSPVAAGSLRMTKLFFYIYF